MALKGSYFTIPKGQLFCLLGPNGAGKTTTINCLTGTMPPSGEQFPDVPCCHQSYLPKPDETMIQQVISRCMGVCHSIPALWRAVVIMCMTSTCCKREARQSSTASVPWPCSAHDTLYMWTGGDALVYGEALSSPGSITRLRERMGVCPQADILWAELTGTEHLHLYGSMKVHTTPAVRTQQRCRGTVMP